MSVDTIPVDVDPATDTTPGVVDVTGVPVDRLDQTLGDGMEDVHLERTPGRTYLVVGGDA